MGAAWSFEDAVRHTAIATPLFFGAHCACYVLARQLGLGADAAKKAAEKAKGSALTRHASSFAARLCDARARCNARCEAGLTVGSCCPREAGWWCPR